MDVLSSGHCVASKMSNLPLLPLGIHDPKGNVTNWMAVEALEDLDATILRLPKRPEAVYRSLPGGVAVR